MVAGERWPRLPGPGTCQSLRMPRILRLILVVSLGLLLLAAIVIFFRHAVLVRAIALEGIPPLAAARDEGPGVEWFDDYYTVEAIDERTFAIGEPRYAQRNYNYLIAGRDRAILFDAGAGHRAIGPVVASLTDKPILFVPSHFHYDHLGDTLGEGLPFKEIAVVDLPELRERASGGTLTLTWQEHLGGAEGFDVPTFEVAQWLAPGSTIDLGDRLLEVIYTPGHTRDSISLIDHEAEYIFAGDFLYPGDLFAFLPTSGAGDYALGAASLLAHSDHHDRIFGAHRADERGIPELDLEDVRSLAKTLESIRQGDLEGAGIYPVRYEVGGDLGLLLEPRPFLRWTPAHPEFAPEAVAAGR